MTCGALGRPATQEANRTPSPARIPATSRLANSKSTTSTKERAMPRNETQGLFFLLGLLLAFYLLMPFLELLRR